MAAAEYYNTRPSNSYHSSFLAPPPHQRASSTPSYVYPQSAPSSSPHQRPEDPPGPSPYNQPLDQHKPSVHFAPTPPPGPPQRNSFSYAQRPNPQSWNAVSYNGPISNPVNPYAPPQQLAPYNQPYSTSQMRPYTNENLSHESFNSGYSSDPERHRRRRKHREGRERGNSNTTRSTNTDGFIGAAGGGLIGDLIFPGLGTVGGALAGWLGGKDYGTHRKWREEKREREQKEWERNWGREDGKSHHHHGHSERSRSRSRDRRRSRD